MAAHVSPIWLNATVFLVQGLTCVSSDDYNYQSEACWKKGNVRPEAEIMTTGGKNTVVKV